MTSKFIHISLFALSFLIVGCGGNSGTSAVIITKPISIKEFDTPPGANPAVSAKMGGAGFEEIASNLGWITAESIKNYGSPESKKGGRFTMSFSEFPASLRTYGKDSNYEIISMMSSLVFESLP